MLEFGGAEDTSHIIEQIGHLRVARGLGPLNKDLSFITPAHAVVYAQGEGHIPGEEDPVRREVDCADNLVIGCLKGSRCPDPGRGCDVHAERAGVSCRIESGLNINMAVSQDLAVNDNGVMRGQDHITLCTACHKVALQEAVLSKIQDNGTIYGLQESGPIQIQVCIRAFIHGDLMVGENRTRDIKVSHRVLFGAEDHLRAGCLGNDVERP